MQIANRQKATEKVNWYQVMLISLGLFGYPVVSFIPAILKSTDSQLFSIPFRALYLILSIVVIIKFKTVKANGRNIAIGLIILFWVMYFIRLGYDSLFNADIIVTPLSTYWLFGLGVCFIPMLAFRAVINYKTGVMALTVSYILCALVNIMGLFQNIGSVDEFSEVRAQGNDFLNPISYGLAGGALAILSLVLFIRNRKAGLKSYLFLLPIPLGIWTLIISLSRGPIIDFLIMLILLFYNSLKSVYAKVLSLIAVTFLLVSLVISFDLPVSDNIVKVLQSTGGSGNQSDEIRLQLMRGGWDQFIHNPIVGDLIEERTLHTYPHNLVIEALMACGLVAGLIHVITIIKSCIQTNLLLKSQTTSWVALLFGMQLLSSMFAGGIYVDYPFWYLLVLTNTIYFQQKLAKEQRNSSKRKV